jgi:hypothetical protein
MRQAELTSWIASVASLRLIRAQAFRAALLWLAVHAFLALVTGSASRFGVKGSLYFALIAAVIGFLDARRRRETAFLGNLGVPQWLGPAVAGLTLLLLELTASISATVIAR